MNSSQLQFYATPADMKRIAGAIESVGQPFLILERKNQGQLIELSDITSGGSLKVAIAREADRHQLIWSPLEERTCLLDDLRSPAIEVIRCRFDKHVLSRGRLYFISRYCNEDGVLVSKRPEFIAWSREVFGAVSKVLSRGKHLDAYVGTDALQWMDSLKRWTTDSSVRIVSSHPSA